MRPRETEHERGRVRERETQNPKQAPGSEPSAQSPTRGSNSRTAKLWPEPKSAAQPTEPPRRPQKKMFKYHMLSLFLPFTFAFCDFFNFYLFLFFLTFIYFWHRERQSMNGGGSERGRHRVWNRLQALSCQHRAQRGARTHRPWDHDLSRSRKPNQLSHPGAPRGGFK